MEATQKYRYMMLERLNFRQIGQVDLKKHKFSRKF
jgi:hypothetical protein